MKRWLVVPFLFLFGAATPPMVPYVDGTIPNQTMPVNSAVLVNPVSAIKCAPEQDSTAGNPVWSAIGLWGTTGIDVSTGRITGNAPGAPNTTVVTVSCTNDSHQVASYAFTMTATGGGAGVLATGYFVDCAAGNDGSNDGLSAATPWRTIGKVNAAVTATGVDVWFKSGTTCTDTRLYPDWPGTAGNRSVIGSYYVSSGVAYQVLPVQDMTITKAKDMTFAQPRAILRGTYQASCRLWSLMPAKCAFDTAGAVPASKYEGMIFSPGTPYITIQSLEIRDSAGGGITVDGYAGSGFYPCQNQAGCQDFTIVQYNLIEHSAYTGFYDQASNYLILRANEISYTGLNRVDSQPNGIDGGGIYISHCDPCHVIVENNYVHDVWNETMGLGAESFVLWRGNQIANGGTGYYSDAVADLVIEQNEFARGSYRPETGLGDPAKNPQWGVPGFCSYCTVKEPGTTTIGNVANASLRVVFRNNFAANYLNCLYIGMADDSVAPASGGFWGNTCIGASGKAGATLDGSPAGVSSLGIDYENNILATTTGVAICSPNFTTPNITMSHNYWTNTSGGLNAQCKGVGDVYSTYSGLVLTNPSSHFADAELSTYPTVANYAVSTFSGAAGAAATLNSTYLNMTNWQWEYDNMTWRPACSAGKPSAAVWAQKNSIDYCDTARNSTIGALNAH